MKTAEPAAPIFYTVAECAAQIGVAPETVTRWIEEGHLATFVPPGKAIGDGLPGPKGLKIFRSQWEDFLRARTMTGSSSTTPAGDVGRSSHTSPRSRMTDRPSEATGTDGISRLKRRPRGPGY